MRLNQVGLGLEIDYQNDAVASMTQPRQRVQSLDVLSDVAARSRSEPATERWFDTAADCWSDRARDSMSATRGGRRPSSKQISEVAWTKRCWVEAVERSEGPPHSRASVARGVPEGGMNSDANCCSGGNREQGSA
jgi:hypothetical protein